MECTCCKLNNGKFNTLSTIVEDTGQPFISFHADLKREEAWMAAQEKKDMYCDSEWKCIEDRRREGKCCLCGKYDHHLLHCGTTNMIDVPMLFVKIISYA